MKAIFRGLSVSMLALAAAGCTTPNPTPLNRPGDVPQAFTAPVADKQAPIWPEANWWVNFKADELPALDGHRPEGKSRPRRRRRARAGSRGPGRRRLRQSAADRQSPEFGPAQRQPSRHHKFQHRSWRHHRPDPGPQCRHHHQFLQAGLAASYSADFWGLNRDRLVRRAKICAPPAMPRRWSASPSQSSVAQQYFTVLATRERIVIARQNIDAAKRILTVVQAKVTNGVSSNLDLAEEQASGRSPGSAPARPDRAGTRSALCPGHPAGPRAGRFRRQGAESGRHRVAHGAAGPAVRTAAAQSQRSPKPKPISIAAHANVDAARAAFFPQISLTGSAGYASQRYRQPDQSRPASPGASAPRCCNPSSTAAASRPRTIWPWPSSRNRSPITARPSSPPSRMWNRRWARSPPTTTSWWR